jgi:hypothetical protein
MAKNNDPAFLFYSSDFLTGCTNLTMEERGQYITLLCIQHQTGHISEKTTRLSVGNASVDVLSKFKIDENGFYWNERLEVEIDKRQQFIDSRRNNGNLGGRPRKEIKPIGYPNDKPTLILIEDEDVNENKDGVGSVKKEVFNFKKSLIELGVENQIATDWIKVRQKRQASNTVTSFNKIKNQIELSGKPANECIKIAVEKDWKGFEADWIIKKENKSYQSESSQRKDAAVTLGKMAEQIVIKSKVDLSKI